MPYDPLRHLRRSIRLVGYDYSHAGAYFFTLVSDRRAALFGEVSGGAFTPSILGEAVQRWWDVIPGHFADPVDQGEKSDPWNSACARVAK